MPEIRMIQQMSGRRADGRSWPPAGGFITVSDDEARELCHTESQQSHPIAEYAQREEERAVSADERDEALQKAPKAVKPAAAPARVEKRN